MSQGNQSVNDAWVNAERETNYPKFHTVKDQFK